MFERLKLGNQQYLSLSLDKSQKKCTCKSLLPLSTRESLLYETASIQSTWFRNKWQFQILQYDGLWFSQWPVHRLDVWYQRSWSIPSVNSNTQRTNQTLATNVLNDPITEITENEAQNGHTLESEHPRYRYQIHEDTAHEIAPPLVFRRHTHSSSLGGTLVTQSLKLESWCLVSQQSDKTGLQG